MNIDIRVALERLVELDSSSPMQDGQWAIKHENAIADAIAALAAKPVGEGPSESDVAELFYHHMGEGSEVGFENAIAEALARWGRPAAPPAPEPGEVGELVDRLGWIAAQLGDIGWGDDSASVARAATLLQQQAAPAPVVVPVAVSDWQPIKTAPKDGTEILASDYDAIEIVSWVAPRFDAGITGEWISREGEAMFPAWWQPLPEHPLLPQAGEGET